MQRLKTFTNDESGDMVTDLFILISFAISLWLLVIAALRPAFNEPSVKVHDSDGVIIGIRDASQADTDSFD